MSNTQVHVVDKPYYLKVIGSQQSSEAGMDQFYLRKGVDATQSVIDGSRSVMLGAYNVMLSQNGYSVIVFTPFSADKNFGPLMCGTREEAFDRFKQDLATKGYGVRQFDLEALLDSI